MVSPGHDNKRPPFSTKGAIMTEEEMRKLASDLRKFASLYAAKSTSPLQFETTAFFIDVVADKVRREAKK
jgi:hypothetical protein